MKTKFVMLLAIVLSVAGCAGDRKLTEVVGVNQYASAEKHRGKVLIIAANPTVSTVTQWPVGAWAAELTHPYYEFEKAGYIVDIASPDGGEVTFDAYSLPSHESGYSAHDYLSRGFIDTPELMAKVKNTLKLSDVDADSYEAIFLVGGLSPMFTFRGNQELMDFVVTFYESDKPTVLVCHATSILLDTKLANGKLLVEGKAWTGFSDEEERAVEEAVGGIKFQPFWIEQEAGKLEGTNFRVKAPNTPYAIRDGYLITGQQQNSGADAAALAIEMLRGE